MREATNRRDLEDSRSAPVRPTITRSCSCCGSTAKAGCALGLRRVSRSFAFPMRWWDSRSGRATVDYGYASFSLPAGFIAPCLSIKTGITSLVDTEMGRQVTVVLYVAAMATVIVGVDLLFFRNRFWERLIVNIGIVLVFAAFYWRFLWRP
jgi:hypothetical protein